MFGPKIRTVFRSRWNALFWSASVLLTAYCSIPSPDQTSDSSAKSTAADARKVAAAVQGTTFDAGPDSDAKSGSDNTNPWAISTDKPPPVKVQGE
ncbi:hypothetical protein [Novosphingobium sp. 9]|uniref:hypothetical protein n=1 Tax=Novosphingobium sp. 9 TaxID=2025349 RepID=UPI0021B6DD36|nr:hypothetical protein [Novosphingobium sp. 9]